MIWAPTREWALAEIASRILVLKRADGRLRARGRQRFKRRRGIASR